MPPGALREDDTANLWSYLDWALSASANAVAVGINLLLTPLIQRDFGALGSLFYMHQPTLMHGAALKIADRGLAYSINRASKELLYIPIDPLLIYQAKAWIDRFGYRLFKVLGSILILALTQWLPWTINAAQLGWLVMAVCLLGCFTLLKLGREYRQRSRAS